MTAPHLPTVNQLAQAFMVAVYTCAMTFLAGMIGQGISIEHWPDWKIAVQAGIAAGLAFLGWTGYTSARGK